MSNKDTGDTAAKKILYVITKSNFGGAQRYVYDLATAMDQAGMDVAVMMGGDGALKEKLEQKHIRTVTIPSLARDISAGKDIRAFFDLISLFREERPDIIHLNSSKAGILGALAGRIARVPLIIFTAHGWAFNEKRSALQRAIIITASWLTLCLSHRVITVSEYDYARAKEIGIGCKKGKLKTIHNGVEAVVSIEKEEARNSLCSKKDSGKLWIGTIAELHKNKGLVYAIEAIAKLPQELREQLTYCIIGEGEERSTLEELIKKRGLENTVFLAGYKDSAASLISAFDLFLLPSEKEGLPYVLLEAGLAGIPVISTNVGGIPEIVEDMKTGIVVHPRNPDEIKTAITYLMTQKEKMEQFGQSLREKVQKEFSTKKMLEKTRKIYDY